MMIGLFIILLFLFFSWFFHWRHFKDNTKKTMGELEEK